MPLQGTTPQGLPEKQPEGDQKDQKQNGAGPSGQNGQGEWVARGGSAKGSRHHGVDPVVPFTEASQLKACPILANPPQYKKLLSVCIQQSIYVCSPACTCRAHITLDLQ